MIPPEIVEQVRHACDIVDVIGGYVPLKKSGAKFKALSPFQQGEDALVLRRSGAADLQVLQQRARRRRLQVPHADGEHDVSRGGAAAGADARASPIPESGPHDPQARSRREELLALNAAVAAWWHKLLHERSGRGTGARLSEEPRDVPESLAEEFGLGYAPDGWDATMKWARKAGLQPGGAGDGAARRDVGARQAATISFAGG